jgi:hypothetical protein
VNEVPSSTLDNQRTLEHELDAQRASAAQRAKVRDLGERLYWHVLRVIDLGALYGLEQSVWSELSAIGLADEECELAKRLLSDALRGIAERADRHASDIPAGITRDEQVAAGYDDDCMLCRNEMAEIQNCRAHGSDANDEDPDFDELASLATGAAQRWRDAHVAVLRRFRLA